ncbi:MAG TPA: dolichol kinase [Methanocella sp.]|uniref:diacylglycerol/polyprenol kinase family protein n=1 Tax=Methanocella sp. TaxID=2052833 RepID=UPI002C3CA9FB|nr:dolichol kinase [Methanocella sp.]HTY91692.1 dolichol kinase [Methanocella sp.]
MSLDLGLLAKEASRKAIHMAGVVVPLAYYFLFSRELILLILLAAVLVAAVLEYVRLSGHPIFPSILLRGHEENGVVGGYFYALLSSFLAVLLFDKAIAVAAILFLDLGDAITGLAGAIMTMVDGPKEADKRSGAAAKSSLVGELRYAVTHPKSPALMAVMLAVCGCIGIALYPSLSFKMIAAGAFGAMVADAFPWRLLRFTVDDNLSIPLVSGALMWLASML